ncbi:MAG: chromosome segregation protein SMC [Syntrophus sp. (in: bacteria)]|nr:chromosome segregation protein SMC [Syntrophus sp. (in: bacteria)]
MRILNVRFKNLNSLTGEWHLDFTHPDYTSGGIFAITGPTGAGKTTILDAVCLAVYGMTPRLDKVSKSGNEIMSRQTGECFAEVTFETQKGRYRCHWSQRRARKRSDGELQPARHEVIDAHTGTILESRITQVSEFIKEVTGMDFKRFTRSMLLAQGDFAAFLNASPDERGPILEQITGTAIYSQISMKVHERRGEERDRLGLLQAGLKGIQVLSEDEERDLQTGLEQNLAREGDLDSRVQDLRKAMLWLEAIAKLEEDIADLSRQWQDFEERQQAFEPEARRLDRSRKALGLEGDYRGAMSLRALQDKETRELYDAISDLPQKETACADARTALETAEMELKDGRTRQMAEALVIRKVRELDARLEEQKKQLDEKQKTIEDGETQKKTYKNHLTGIEASLNKIRIDLTAVDNYLSEHATDAGLPASIEFITRGFAALSDLEAKRLKAQEKLSEAVTKKESAIAASKKIEADHGKYRIELEEGQRALKDLTDEIEVVLQGRDIGSWREEADSLKNRDKVLVHAADTIERIGRMCSALAELEARLETLKAAEDNLAGEIKSYTDKKRLLEKDIVALEMQVSLLNRIRNLEEDRKRLEDGKPCPLCGAIDHPFALGNVPELNDAETELKNLKAELKSLSEVLRKQENRLVKMAAEIEHAGKAMVEKQTALAVDEKQCADTLAKLDIIVLPEERAGKVIEDLALVQVKIIEISRIITMVDNIGRKEKTAQGAVEKLRVQFEGANKALHDIMRKLETSGIECEQLYKECDALAEETDKAHASALKDVEPFGVKQIPSANLEAILKALDERKAAWQAKADEKTSCEKKIVELKAAMDKDQTLLKNLESDLAARYTNRDNLSRAYETLKTSRQELFSDKNPDQEEKRLADAVDRAGQAFEKARETHGRIDKETGALKEKIAVLKEKTENRAAELEQAEQKMAGRITLAGFADEADYLSARLSEEEHERLDGREKSLIKERTELDARRKDRSEALVAQREKKLTDQPLEALREDMAACEIALKQISESIGAIKNSLGENTKLREKLRESLQAIEAQQKEWARWDALHQLIGSADGKKFRNFAQGLTFETMTAHANRQLRKMTDRYLLVRDTSQPLELNVIDNYQAGEIRSTKNLSGGESFIVSLALSLGLSQMASRNVRIDSLFLDEGFGSLDEDALETALETLAGLQQDGKLIGVISHVPALKERIGIQIQVIPKTGGRSVIEGPGCQRCETGSSIK